MARRCETAAVWVSDDGRLNTVALPDPSETMTDEFRQSLEVLARSNPGSLAEVIEEAEDAAYSRDWSDLAGRDEYVDLPPPVEILRGSVRTTEKLAAALAAVELRWMLDVIIAVGDYLD